MMVISYGNGVSSDLYVVKGIEIGHEIVSVLLLEPEFEHIEDKIVITVAEAMSIDPPSPVFVIIGASFNYSLKVIRQNTPQAIALPSPYHRWSVLNSSVALVDTMMGLARAVNLGVTTVSVEDMRVSGHVQMSSLHVVLPDTLTFYIVPVVHSGDPVEGIKAIPSVARWYVVAGYQYVIYTKVFSRSGAVEIYITETDDLELHYNQFEHWETFFVPDNISAKHGWRKSRFLKATSQGLGRLTASLTYHSGQLERKEVLKVVQEVMVCNKVTFSMDKINGISQNIHVPWVPGVSQEVELRATGGCAKTSSDYKWFSSDTAIVSVSASGVAQAKKPGQATIKVVSVFDSLNYDEVVVEVSTPLSMVMLQNFSVEVVVGTHLQAAVTMISSNGAYFYRCDAFNTFVKWKVGSESFRIVDEKEELLVLDNLQNFENFKSVYIPICAWTYIYASSAGQAMLHATLSREQYIDQNFEKPSLNAYSLIAAYPPLIVCQAGDGNEFGGYSVDFHQSEASNQCSNLDEIYLVPGTQLDVMLRGGPEQWGQDVDFFETVEILDDKHMHLENGAFVQQAPSNNGKSYKVSCQTLGNYKIVFSLGNLVGDEHPLPAIAKVEVSISCSFPSSITLIANEPVNAPAVIQSATEAERSPEKVRVAPVTVANNCTIRIAAVGIHKSRNAFANSSSLCLKWDLCGCDGLAYWSETDGLGKSGTSWERFLVLHDASGLCILHAMVIGFCDTLIGHLSEKNLSLLEDLENVLTDAIRLQLVSSLRVLPDSVLLFFSPDAKLVSQGPTASRGESFHAGFIYHNRTVGLLTANVSQHSTADDKLTGKFL